MTTGWRTLRIGLASLVTTALLGATWLPLTLAGSLADPEIRDGMGDAAPSAFAVNSPQNASLFENLTAYDVVAAWIGLESVSDFWIFIRVRDLPDDWGALGAPPSQSPFGANASFSGTSLVANFTIAGVTYEAIAKLAEVSPGGVADNYSLWRGPQWAPLSGSYDVEADLVYMRLPKAAFDDPSDGARLQNIWVMGRFGDRAMDYAPNARDVATGISDPLDLLGKLQSGKVTAQPQFGRDYVFGQYYHPPPPGSPSTAPGPGQGPLPDLAVSIVGSEERVIAAGDSVTYQVRIHNRAAQADTAYLVLSSAQEGWSHHLSETQLSLGPGQANEVFLTVFASEAAVGSQASRIDVSSSLGAAKSAATLTRILVVDDGPGPDDDSVSPVPAPKGGSPGAGFATAAVAIGLLALAVRRRRP